MPATVSLNDLREQRAALATEVKEIRSSYEKRKAEGKKGDELFGGAEGRKKLDEIEKRRKDLDAEIKDIEDENRLFELDVEQRNDPSPPQFKNGINHDRELMEQRSTDNRLALRAWAGHGSKGFAIDKRTKEACQRLDFDPSQGQLELRFGDTHSYREMRRAFGRGQADELIEKRALSALQPTAGGATIGTSLVNQIEANMLFFGSIEQISEVMLTDGGEDMNWPTADDTSNEGELLGENVATADDDEPTFGRIRWGAYEFSSKVVRAPRSLVTDSGQIESLLGRMLGERVARHFNRKCTSGTGNSQPRGYLVAASEGEETASSTALTRAELINLIHSVDPAYRSSGRCRMVMHDLVLAEIRKLLDSQNRPLDLITYDADGTPRFKEGNYPITLNNHMDSALAAANKSVAFGDFTCGKVRRVRSVVVQRLVERYAEYNQIGYLTIVRQDYNVLDAGTDPITYLEQKP